jgi:hypothetical protein
MPEDFLRAKNISYPKNASTDLSTYYSVAFYNSQYYFSVDKTIFYTSEVAAE